MNKLQKVEIWVATGIYLLALLTILFPVLSYDGRHSGLSWLYNENGVPYDHFLHSVWPGLLTYTALYGGFLLLNFRAMPQFLEHHRYWRGIAIAGGTAVGGFLLLMVAESWKFGYRTDFSSVRAFHNWCAGRAMIIVFVCLVVFAVYSGIKSLVLAGAENGLGRRIAGIKIPVDMIILIIIWLAATFFFILDRRPARTNLIFWSGGCYIIAYYFISRRFFGPLLRKERHWKELLPNAIMVFLVTYVLACVLADASTNISNMSAFYFLIFVCQLLIVPPLAWWLTWATLSQKNEVLTLEKALGRSSANLDFLRSQINPHFLFNALNTLYGTALQEQAGRTSEGIQRLGDMMRFMLHENTVEKIHLSKEVGYLQNYIALQRLRTQESPDIKIEVNIQDANCEHAIAPMLLIPFVENAFKHGISLRNRSWIVVSLSCDDHHIYFDAYNSLHPKRENDPERNSLGIGLNNVRQRLEHVYPGRHELSIRETASEFFVHLTLKSEKIAPSA
ncbi:sensor histidine kinase [Chitinophaga rhizosphaerae]|uniref:sensor histidine kinase n=1 Tax=Chitinophaga rhizosphaerae TaxID=1864947 RepID=UPI00196B0243|nr:histidine kinase [Chitinophaga rhizosphaerae]